MESINIKELNDRIQRESSFVDILTMEMNKVIVGQKHLVENLLIGLLANGHILLEGVPGLAKTLAINTLSQAVDSKFSRIQFTPDLLPADVLGTMIYSQKTEQFQIKKGPVFANFVLADEINRSPAKVQSALLEAMQERQVTIGDETFKLPEPFLVMATQNPIEQEGTYPLPEAQLDRFMFNLKLDYPSYEEEIEVVKNTTSAKVTDINPVMTAEEIVQNYQIKLMKIIFKEIDSLMTKKENADINAHKLAENGNSVRTSAYWKSVGNAEFYIKEIYSPAFESLGENRVIRVGNTLYDYSPCIVPRI